MKIAKYTGTQQIEVTEKQKPEITSDQILVKVAFCGICGSDVHAYTSGAIYQPGTVMGHECSGTVVEIGANISGFEVGDRVVVKPFGGTVCGQCAFCRNEQPKFCLQPTGTSIGLTPDLDGGFAEFVKVTHPMGQLIKIPDDLSLEEAALSEPLAVAMHAIRLSKFRLGDRSLVIGAGPIGLAIVDILRLGGAGRITVIEKSATRAAMALKMGADEVLDPDVEGLGLREKVFFGNDGIGPKIVFECAGSPATFILATGLVQNGGQVMAVSIIEKEAQFMPLGITVTEVDIKGSFGYRPEDFQHVVEFLGNKRLKAGLMISDIIKLADIDEKGFKQLLSAPEQIKILVKP
jgi:threonine dehydrogenase-like Zn-dependent dehydrogenase